MPAPTAASYYFTFLGISSFYAVPWDAERVFIGADVQSLHTLAYRSTDGGLHWSRPWYPKTHTILVDASVIAFAGVSATHTLVLSDFGRVYRSTDGGASWVRSDAGLPDGTTIWTLLAAPTGSTVYAGVYTKAGGNIYASADDGRTWHAISS